ncbi:putative calcium-binding protein CML50 [Acorus calamus]|uniref:Calcium-binding protein CML50 n=1 Tax=Acorus calamus TaxID=4465 RepID=A0AAV9EYM1_ACOCL|nr:putative calcium-binding protein CML50 [Acorus calamus]
MSGYPPGSNYPSYGGSPPTAQPYPYGGPPPPHNPYAPVATPYGAAPSAPPYGAPPAGDKPSKPDKYGSSSAYGSAPSAPPYGAPPGEKPSKPDKYGGGSSSPYGGSSAAYGAGPQGSSAYGSGGGAGPHGSSAYGGGGGAGPHGSSAYGGGGGAGPHGSSGGYPGPPQGYGMGSPFASLVPSTFPPGTDPNIVACFQAADQDGSGFIDDKELQSALSSYNQSFSIRTVHLLMYLFTNSNVRRIGPKEFTSVFYSLQSWRSIFERFDRDRSGKIDISELRDALMSLGFAVSPAVLDLLVSKFDKSGGKNKAIEYDNFIECCLTVKGLTEKFKEKDTTYSGTATFTYEAFMLTVLPFLIA